jgi:hypothetical protein
MALSGMRGLSVFISDVRNCHNKEQERVRVDKELGNIRTRFKNEKVSRPLAPTPARTSRVVRCQRICRIEVCSAKQFDRIAPREVSQVAEWW